MKINGRKYIDLNDRTLTGPEIGFIQKCARYMNLAWEPIASRPEKAAVLFRARTACLVDHDLPEAAGRWTPAPDHLRDLVVTVACEAYREKYGPKTQPSAAEAAMIAACQEADDLMARNAGIPLVRDGAGKVVHLRRGGRA